MSENEKKGRCVLVSLKKGVPVTIAVAHSKQSMNE